MLSKEHGGGGDAEPCVFPRGSFVLVDYEIGGAVSGCS